MGRIYLRNKVWYSNYWLRGERIRKPLSPNRREAQAIQDQMEAAGRFQKHGLIPDQMGLSGFLDTYLKMRRAERRPNTYAHTRLAFDRLRDVFAIKYLSEITPQLLEKAKIKWREKQYGESAIGSYVMQIKVAMKTAAGWQYVQPQPWNMVKGYISPGRLIYYTMSELQKMIDKTSGIWRTAILLMARAGLRSGEVRHLEWGDVQFDTHMLWIHAKPFWKPKGWKPNKPHERFVDMPKDLEAHLKSLGRGQGFVLGPVLVPESVYAHFFMNLIAGVGLRGSAHCFRHTYAAHLVSEGVTLEELGGLLGHTNPITTQIYAHLMPHARRRAVDRLPALVSEL